MNLKVRSFLSSSLYLIFASHIFSTSITSDLLAGKGKKIGAVVDACDKAALPQKTRYKKRRDAPKEKQTGGPADSQDYVAEDKIDEPSLLKKEKKIAVKSEMPVAALGEPLEDVFRKTTKETSAKAEAAPFLMQDSAYSDEINDESEVITSNSASPSEPLLGATVEEDPFFWHTEQHYKKLAKELKEVSSRQLRTLIEKIIEVIDANEANEFFSDWHEAIINFTKRRIYIWLRKYVLAIEEGVRLNAKQRKKLYDIFEIEANYIEDLDPNKTEVLTIDHVHTFIEEHVEGGGSWLINEAAEGEFEISSDFVETFKDCIGAPQDLLEAIFGGLWFNYDWVSFDIRDPRFLQETYIQTLEDFINDSSEESLKERIKITLRQAILYDPNNFSEPFETLREDYNQYVSQHDWRNALVVWSVYSIYRKNFQRKNREEEIKGDDPFSAVFLLKKDRFLLDQLKKCFERAQGCYTKVYPDPDTSHVIYGSKRTWRVAKLELKPVLSELKSIGQRIEQYRPGKQSENILVPALFFVISDRPHIKGGKHGRKFVRVDLNFDFFQKRLLTRNTEDGVFVDAGSMDSNDTYFFDRAKQDYVAGQIIRGVSKKNAEALFDGAATRPNELLIHSERTWIELLRNERVVEELVQSLKRKIATQYPEGYDGKIKVYSVLSLLYSTNSVCPYCTPSLISAQNSHDKGGFLYLLTKKLNEESDRFSFKTRGLFEKEGRQDPGKFRLHTIVTATTNFDSQALDLTDEGQHNHATSGRGKLPKTHNPHARLIFPDNAIDLHKELLLKDGQRDPAQRFFYEFVGKDLHKDAPAAFPFADVVFSSGGSSPWSNRIPPDVLGRN